MTAPAPPRHAMVIVCPTGPERGRIVDVMRSEDASVHAALAEVTPGGEPNLLVLAAPRAAAALNDQLTGAIERWPQARVIVVCELEGDARGAPARLLRAGAAGIVGLSELERTLAPTVAAVRAGQVCVPHALRSGLAPPSLSRRERQTVGLVVMGMSNGEIAAQLHLTESTVKSHLTGAYRKLGVSSRAQAIDRLLDPVTGLGAGILAVAGGDR